MAPVRHYHRRLRGCLAGAILCGIVLALAPARLSAAGPSLVVDAPEQQGRRLLVSYSLAGLFDEEIRASLEAGFPATMIFRWRLWRQRDGWPDSRVDSGRTLHRVYYDVLEDRFEVFNGAGRSIAGCATVAEVENTLCGRGSFVVGLAESLHPEHLYFLELEVGLEPVDTKEIKGLETWLQGGSEGEGGKSVFSGISRYAEGLLKRMAGLGGRSAWARSEPFRGGG